MNNDLSEIEPPNQATPEIIESDLDMQPQTPLGRELMKLRAKHIKSGGKLLTADEVLEEKARRRGTKHDIYDPRRS